MSKVVKVEICNLKLQTLNFKLNYAATFFKAFAIAAPMSAGDSTT